MTFPIVVIVAFRIPDYRVTDFFRWNDELFRKSGAKVVIVTDPDHPPYTLPDYAVTAPYTEPLPLLNGRPVFSLARTKNAGLAVARNLTINPGTPIICSDIDIAFDESAWNYLTRDLIPLRAYIPIYRMAYSWEHRHTEFIRDKGATGTISMRAADWSNIHYDRRYIGYGAEDGKILQDLQQHGFHIDRKTTVHHIAHVRDTDQRNFRGRTDYHNPDFNPFRLHENAVYATTPTPDPDDPSFDNPPPSTVWPQYIGFELIRSCNRAIEHYGKCPSGDIDRYGQLDTSRVLTGETVLSCIRYAYQNGFNGHIVWHYYNEPLLAWPRTKPLMQRIRTEFPQSKFTLWSNGDMIRRPGESESARGFHTIDPAELSDFDICWVSNYAGIDWSFLTQHIPRVCILDGNLDARKHTLPRPDLRRCLRPFNELIIDHYGNGHLCCADWQGTAGIGNIFTLDYATVVSQYMQLRDLVARQPMPQSVPALCKTCPIRSTTLGILVPEAAATQQAYIDQLSPRKVPE